MNMWERVIRAVLDSAVVIVLTLSLLWVFLWLASAVERRQWRKDTPANPPIADGLTPHLHTFEQVEGRRVAVCACGSSIWTSR